MTKISFVVRNSFRNKRRSIFTMLSIGFSLLLLTFMMTIWRSFYMIRAHRIQPNASSLAIASR